MHVECIMVGIFDVLGKGHAQEQRDFCRWVIRNSFFSANLLTVVDKVVLVNSFWRNNHIVIAISSCDIWLKNSDFLTVARVIVNINSVTSSTNCIQYIAKSEIGI